MKLKVGDKVKCLVDEWSSFTKNNIYEVCMVNEKTVGVTNKYNSYITMGYGVFGSDFDLVCHKEEESPLSKAIKEDIVNQPSHYTQGKIEVIDFIEDSKLNYHLGNVIKYICRHKYKGKPIEDLKKSRWYLDRYIKMLESDEK